MEKFVGSVLVGLLGLVLSQAGTTVKPEVEKDPFASVRYTADQVGGLLDQGLPQPAQDTQPADPGQPPAPPAQPAQVADTALARVSAQLDSLLESNQSIQRATAQAVQQTVDSVRQVEEKVAKFVADYGDAVGQDDYDKLVARIDELEKKLADLDARCTCGKATTAAPAAPPVKSGGSNGSVSYQGAAYATQAPAVVATSGSSNGTSRVQYSQPVYQPQPVYSTEPVVVGYSETPWVTTTVASPGRATYCVDANGNPVPCNSDGGGTSVRTRTVTNSSATTRVPLLPWRR